MPPVAEKFPPLTFDTSLDLVLLVVQANTLRDLGIAALAFIARYGTCSIHGAVSDEVEVSNGVAPAGDYIRCPHCKVMGVTRRCPVETIGPIGPEEG